ncbi:MAG: hypothetical protein CMI32_04995 [Opitutales bacterium]|nr:hypothetical protein [Opitutales bacterium]
MKAPEKTPKRRISTLGATKKTFLAMDEPLTPDQIANALGGLPGWSHQDDRFKKSFFFDNFRASMAFIVRLSFEAEQRDHHQKRKSKSGNRKIVAGNVSFRMVSGCSVPLCCHWRSEATRQSSI